MPEFITVEEKIERRTYLKGQFSGKFVGRLDENNSDLKWENFYDLEMLDAKITADKANFRTWKEGTESTEFLSVGKFLTKLPTLIPCEIRYEDGIVKFFNLHINEPKLNEYKLFNQLYEQDKLFVTIEGAISGYLKHYDTELREIEVIPPEPKPIEETKKAVNTNTFNNSTASYGNSQQRGLNHPRTKINWDDLVSGCASLVALIFIAYLFLGFVLLIAAPILKTLSGIRLLILPTAVSIVLPIFFIGIIFYVFVKVQHRLHTVWRWLFHLIIIALIFLLLFN